MNGRKRPAQQPPVDPQPAKHLATEEEYLDEDVFFEESLVDEDEFILHQEALANRLQKWKRPSFHSHSQSIVFQQLEIDYIVGESHQGLIPNSSGSAPIIRIFGVTKEGHSVCCNVHGFEPYFYISCPPGMGPDDISRFHKILEGRMREANKNNKFSVPKFILRVELVQKRSIMYYQQHSSQPFLKIVVALPSMVANCRGILDKGIQIDGFGMKSFMTYESNVLFVLRFMFDCKIVGGNWIEVPPNKYKTSAKSLSYSQFEFHCLYPHLSNDINNVL